MFANNVTKSMKFIAAIIRINEQNMNHRKSNVGHVSKRFTLVTNYILMPLKIGAVQKPSQQ